MNTSPLFPRKRFGAVFGLMAMVLVVAGCVSTPPPRDDFPVPPEPVIGLQPGDVLNFQFVYWPELSDTQTVRPDGKVALKLVGDVPVQDQTPDQVRAKLVELYADKIKSPEINVVVQSYDSQRIYIAGEVHNPGVIALRGRMTVMDALFMAGGPLKESARLKTVVLVRVANGKQVGTTINLRKSLQDPETDPIYLAPCDIIFVPRTPIDRVDQWVEQYINKIVPRNATTKMTFYKDVGPGPIKNNVNPAGGL